jgi:hypothetical protein
MKAGLFPLHSKRSSPVSSLRAHSSFVSTTSCRFKYPLKNFVLTDSKAHSPRWLISKGRKEEAVKVMDEIRPKEDVESGATRLEVEAIDEYLQNLEKAPWIDLFVGQSQLLPVNTLWCN